MLRGLRSTLALGVGLGLAASSLIAAPVAADTPAPHLLSLGRPATSTGTEAQNANDADPASSWQSPLLGGRHAWWQVDLQQVSRITRIVNRGPDDGRSYRYYVRTSLDGVHWSAPVVREGTGVGADSDSGSHSVEAVGRYVKVDITAVSEGTTVGLTDFQVYGYVTPQATTSPLTTKIATEAGAYESGRQVAGTLSVHNTTGRPLGARVQVVVAGLTDPYFLDATTVDRTVRLQPHQTRRLEEQSLWSIPKSAAPGAYAVRTVVTLPNGERWDDYETFVRVVGPDDLTRFKVNAKASYRGYPVYELDGGLSAELLVSTSANALNASVGSAWKAYAPGQGTRAVVATPDFLENAIETTVDTYDSLLGRSTPFQNAVIGTGVLSTHYMGSTLKAPVLPSQFLVSVDSYKELETLLDRANERGLAAYATLGYDYSLQMPGVAWVKLLDAPGAYQSFLRRHHVKNVLLSGTAKPNGGEVRSKQILRDSEAPVGHYRSGDIYLMFPGTSDSDVPAQYRAIVDIGDAPLEATFRDVSDWESGLADPQITGLAAGVRHRTGVRDVAMFSSDDTGALYTAAAYAALAYMKKNAKALSADGHPVLRGVAMNPYDNPRPFLELATGRIPLPFWQGTGDFWTTWNVDRRFNTILRDAVHSYFPEVDFDKLSVNLNVSRNFGAAPVATSYGNRLRELGFTTTIGDPTVDDVWDPADGMNSLGEKAVRELADEATHAQSAALQKRLQPLTFDELAAAATKLQAWFPTVELRRLG